MAIINGGEILLEAVPAHALDALRGRIWRRVISKNQLPRMEQDHAVISTKLLGGSTIVHVYSEAQPEAGFEHAEPDLKDVFFSTMAGHIGHHSRKMEVSL
jgi:hypothetical protein